MPAGPRLTCDLPGLFVTGTDTGIGKTRMAAAIVAAMVRSGRRVGVLKPVATGAIVRDGARISEDGAELGRALGDAPPGLVVPLLYDEPLAPPVAARRAGTPLHHADLLRVVQVSLDGWRPRADLLVVEGVGGFLCPLAEGTTVADLAIELDFPLIVVARRALGTLNHTLLTLEAARRRGLRVAGVLLNASEPGAPGLAEQTNAEELSRRLGDDIPLLAEVDYAIDQDLISSQLSAVDWPGLAQPSRFAFA